MKNIYIGDIMYDPIKDTIIQVTGFSYDRIGQRAILFEDRNHQGSKTGYVTAWIAFKHFVRLEKSEYLK